LTRPGKDRRTARMQRTGAGLESHHRRLRTHGHGGRLSGKAPRTLTGQFIVGGVRQAPGRPFSVGTDLPMPSAAGHALLGIARGPDQRGTASAADRRGRRFQGHDRCRVRNCHRARRSGGGGGGSSADGVERNLSTATGCQGRDRHESQRQARQIPATAMRTNGRVHGGGGRERGCVAAIASD
jgi:hypothetical protein